MTQVFKRGLAMASNPPKIPLIAIIGATGTGKSKLAVELATRYDGEIINGDAMQMYRGLPIITNKLPVKERMGVPHHLLGCISLSDQPWTVSNFIKQSKEIIGEIRSRGKIPILVGGTHYYVDALLFEDSLIASEPPEDSPAEDGFSSSEQRWPILCARTAEIYAKLKEVDPAMANRWHPNDRRHMTRSLEIWLQTGIKASEIYEAQHQTQRVVLDKLEPSTTEKPAAEDDKSRLRFSSLTFWLYAQDDVLKTRLDGRVHDMLAAGLVPEAQSLEHFQSEEEAKGNAFDTSRGIWISIGYKELQPYLSALRNAASNDDEISRQKQKSIEAIQSATRQYAKNQIRWIRSRSVHALLEAGARDTLFLLDTTDLSQWHAAVTEPSRKVVDAFLAGGSLPEPRELSSAALEILPDVHGRSSGNQTMECRTCDVCNKILVTDREWEAHLKGRRHRRVLQGMAKKERNDAYLARLGRTENAPTPGS